MKQFINKHWPAVVIVFLAVVTRFYNLSYPAEVVFDEVHFGKFASAYFTGQYYFDLHPPLGKLLIYFFAKALGLQSGFAFLDIGEVIEPHSLLILRFLPALAGSLLILLIYKLLQKLNLSRKTAFLGASLILLDNALLVESKFILLDLFLIVFGFFALYLFLCSEDKNNKKQYIYLIASGIFVGLSLSIKWTGLSFAGLILLFLLVKFIYDFNYKKFLLRTLIFIVLVLSVYIVPFTIHLSLLPNSGQGDAYMSESFQKSLIGNRLSPENSSVSLGFWGKFIELNRAMYSYNTKLTATHPDGSKWYEWPLDRKPIYYWNKSVEGIQSKIYLVGNPFIWLLGTCTVIISIILLLFKKVRRVLSPEIYLLIVGYLANLLPFIYVTRVAFLYHYFSAFIFSILIFCLLWERLWNLLPDNVLINRITHFLYTALIILALAVFVLLSPLSYGWPIPSNLQQMYDSFINYLHRSIEIKITPPSQPSAFG